MKAVLNFRNATISTSHHSRLVIYNGWEMSRTPLGAGGAIYCSSRDKGGGAAVGGAAPLMVRAACGENPSMVQLAPVRAAAGGANIV